MFLRRDNINRRLRKAVFSVQGRTGDVTLTATDVSAQAITKDNLTATTNPTETDDGTQGYEVLSKWMNVSTGKIFTCLNIAHGSAIWKSDDINIADLGSAALKNIGTGDYDVPLMSDVKNLIPAPQTKTSLGLDQVSNTSDANKPVSTAQAQAIQDAKTSVLQTTSSQLQTALGSIDYSTILNVPVQFSGSYNDLTNKPSLFNGDYTTLSNKPTLFDGKYTSLTGTPILFDGEWTSVKNKPAFFDGKFTSLISVPNFFDGAYSSLSGRPVLFSGSWIDLTDKPMIFDGKFSSLTGTPAFFSGSYTDLTNLPSLFNGNYNSLTNLPTLFSGSWNNLTDKPTLFNGSYTSLSNLPVLFSGVYGDLTGKPNLFSGQWSDLLNKPAFFSGSYTDLTNKPVIFSGSFLDLTNKPAFFSGLYSDLTGKPTLFSGSYTDLTNKPTIPTSTTQISEGTNLYYTDARVQTYLTSKNIKGVKYFDVTTDANSIWTVDVSTYFSAVDFVDAIALSPMAGSVPLITEQRFASVLSISATTVKGSVSKANTLNTVLISVGAPGLVLFGVGAAVKVKVEGTLK